MDIPAEAKEFLDEEFHGPLIKDIKAVAASAGIPQSMIWTSMVDRCSPGEIEYFRGLRTAAVQDKIYGAVYVSEPPQTPSVANRMMLLAAACIRNYINARVVSLRTLINNIKNDEVPTTEVLCIPDFCIGKSEGGKVPEWVIHGLLSLLYERQAAEQQTLLYIKSWNVLQAEYGSAFSSHLRTNFFILEF